MKRKRATKTGVGVESKPFPSRIPCLLMRGGTSKGTFFLKSDLPSNWADQERLLLRLMGRHDSRRVDSIGGTDSLTTKVAIINKSSRPDADVEYLFAQPNFEKGFLDISVNCGNILSAVGPYALERGMVPASDIKTTIRILNLNTGVLVHATLLTPDGRITYEGDTVIDGVPGSGAPILLSFLDPVGSKTGKLMPTGLVQDRIAGIPVTCLDVATPMVIVPAPSLGKTALETPDELNADRYFLSRLEEIRQEAGRRMGMGNVGELVMPKICLVGAPAAGGRIASRYFTPRSCHSAYAVTGALCLATACVIEGSVAEPFFRPAPDWENRKVVSIEHPTGKMEIAVEANVRLGRFSVSRLALVRTARPIFDGNIIVPSDL